MTASFISSFVCTTSVSKLANAECDNLKNFNHWAESWLCMCILKIKVLVLVTEGKILKVH